MIEEQTKGDEMLKSLIKRGEEVPNFGSALGELYASAGIATLPFSPDTAKEYFLKAKKSLTTHLTQEDDIVQILDTLIHQSNYALAMKKPKQID